MIKDGPWLKETFISIVQQRGAAIIKARGASSAASAANAAVAVQNAHARWVVESMARPPDV